ncbi:MAG: universal stress protein [Bryobacterales bacterium]
MHLLAATDFSEHAGFAMERAAALASLHHDAALTVMHVYAAEGSKWSARCFALEVEEARGP